MHVACCQNLDVVGKWLHMRKENWVQVSATCLQKSLLRHWRWLHKTTLASKLKETNWNLIWMLRWFYMCCPNTYLCNILVILFILTMLLMRVQSETTLWRLKFFVREALERQANVASGRTDENAKRKREICNALARTASKRVKQQPN